MSVIDEVRRERDDLARVLKKHTGIRRIVEDLYPDSAHFIYELLQNAEDAGATEAHFTLRSTSLVFEHNGRPFEPRDIYAITDIGEGTKAEDDDKIGRFGVGFKAVFAYSETPHIWSPTFSFRITDLVLPSELDAVRELGNRTRFEFPFNNPKKAADTAFDEVEEGLSELAETTLLFLSHLVSVSWQVEKGVIGEILRVQHSENHIEILKQGTGTTTASGHFLKFDRPVEGLEKQRIAVAFELDFLPDFQGFDAKKALVKQLKIVPASPGRVAVFFAAEKESSGLRFHLHAPFVPELSRASVKETPANFPLFDQLAELAASSLHQVRDLGLLTADFLGTLPNPQDSIPARYQVIRSAIVDAMNTQPLTPTYAKSHAPAEHLLQARAPLKSLLSDTDIELLVNYGDNPPHWAISASQRNSNVDRFLEALAIQEWGIEEFVQVLRNKTAKRPPSRSPEIVTPEQVVQWLRAKPLEWHQEFYAVLQTEYLSESRWHTTHFESLQIVRQMDGRYGVASETFFASDGVEHDEALRVVDPAVYSTGKSKTQKENARTFLEAIGVREVGDAELVEIILKRRYTHEAEIPDEKTYKKDLKRFIALIEKDPKTASLFKGYFIFECCDFWRTPDEVFLDRPYLDTGLSAYYTQVEDGQKHAPLSENYEKCGVGAKSLVKFAGAVGAKTRLEATETHCHANPEWRYLQSVRGERYTSPINRDFTIVGLEKLLAKPSLAISLLVWRTMCALPQHHLQAVYRKNESGGCHLAASQLVHVLRRISWVPQTGGQFVRPQDATRESLPDGFQFDSGWQWIQAIQFGQQLAKRTEEQIQRQSLAKKLGFNDEATLERAKRFAALPTEVQRRILDERERQAPFELPDHEPSNPERRAERVAALATDAPERTTEKRARSVSVGVEAIKQEAGQYLRQQYTNADGQMICQVCKNKLPFKLDDGSYYFERVELLSGLKRRHQQNYLALCPNHAAMFQYANGSTDELRGLVVELVGNEMAVVLAKEDTTIYFTKTHLADLKAIISADQSEPETKD